MKIAQRSDQGTDDPRDLIGSTVRVHRIGTSSTVDLVGTLDRAQEAGTSWALTVTGAVPTHANLTAGSFYVSREVA